MATKKKIVRRHITKKPNLFHSLLRNRFTLSLTVVAVIIVASLVTAALAYGRGPLVPLFATTTGIYQIDVQIESPEEMSQIQKPEILFAAPPKGPISDDPTAAAIAAATRQKAIQDKLGITNEASIAKAAEQGAQQSIQLTTQATGGTPKPAAITAQQVQQATNIAVATVKKAAAKKAATTPPIAQPTTPSTLIDPNAPKCQSNNGSQINAGETVIGPVSNGKNTIYKCGTDGKFHQAMCTNGVPDEKGTTPCYQDSKTDEGANLVTMKPIYLGGQNCYKNSTAYKPGDTLKDNDKYQKCENGNWVIIPVPDVPEAAPAAATPEIQNPPITPKSPEEITCTDPKNGGTWDAVNKRCGAGPGNCTGNFVWNPTKKTCTAKTQAQLTCEGGGGSWNLDTNQCGAGPGNCVGTWDTTNKKCIPKTLVPAPGAFGETAAVSESTNVITLPGSIVTRTVNSCTQCNAAAGETCEGKSTGLTCINKGLIATPIKFPEPGEPGSTVSDPSLCKGTAVNSQMIGKYNCLSQADAKTVEQINAVVRSVMTPGAPGSIVDNPKLCKIGSVESGVRGKYTCLSKEGLENVNAWNAFTKDVVNWITKESGTDGSIVNDPKTCNSGSSIPSTVRGKYTCLSADQKKQVDDWKTYVENVNTPGEPGSTVDDPTKCKIGSVKSTLIGKYTCLSKDGLESVNQVDNIGQQILNFIFKKPGEPGTTVDDAAKCLFGSVDSPLKGKYNCVSAEDAETVRKMNEAYENTIKEILRNPVIREVNSCSACSGNEGCVLAGNTGYQCISVIK